MCISMCVCVTICIRADVFASPRGWMAVCLRRCVCVLVNLCTCISLGHDSSLLAFGLLPPYIINPKHL